MATYSRVLLTASVDGAPVVIANIASPGTIIHTAVAGVVSFDEVYLWVANVSAAAVTLTLGIDGDAADAALACKGLSIPANSPLIPILTGQTLNNANVVRAYASVANVLNAVGHVNRIA